MSYKLLTFRFVLIANLLGNTLEWYEYICFAFLTPVFEKIFFPYQDPWITLVFLTLGLFFGHVLRPVGGLLFGFIGDRFGRKIALISSVLSMSLPSLLIGFLPTYAQLGLAAFILLLVMRLFQGIAAGGELPGTVTFIVESSPEEKKGFFGSFVYFGIFLGIFLGAIDFFFMDRYLSPDVLFSWGWRSMYIFGALLGCAAFFLRYKLHETPAFQHLRGAHEILRDPLRVLFQKHKTGILKLIGIEILETFGFNLLIPFSTIYFTTILAIPMEETAKLNLLFLLLFVVAIPLMGLCIRRIGAQKMALLAAVGFFLFSFPLYWMLQQESLRVAALAGLALLSACYIAPMPVLYCELFPTRVRLSGIGFGYNFATGLIGGLTPFLALSLIHYTGWKLIPALFLMGGSLISFATLRTFKSTAG